MGKRLIQVNVRYNESEYAAAQIKLEKMKQRAIPGINLTFSAMVRNLTTDDSAKQAKERKAS